MIAAIVVDTDVISYFFKGDSRAGFYRPRVSGKIGIISFMTLAELRRWTISRNWGETRKQDLESNYSIVHSDSDLCAEWAEVAQSAIRRGRPITRC